MRYFNHENVSLRFQVAFGVASSDHKTTNGEEYLIILLAGPVPGILLGTFLGIINLNIQNSYLWYMTGMLVLINGFNLLPVLPLDGGKIIQALLYKRLGFVHLAHYGLSLLFGLVLIIFMQEYFMVLLVIVNAVILVSGIINRKNLNGIEGFRSCKPYKFEFRERLFYFILWGFFISLAILFLTQRQHFISI